MGRKGKPDRRPGEGRAKAADAPELSPEDDRARRFLDLWERNLSFLALDGPTEGGPPSGG